MINCDNECGIEMRGVEEKAGERSSKTLGVERRDVCADQTDIWFEKVFYCAMLHCSDD